VTNGQVASTLLEIASMLEFVEEQPFKPRAYRKAADVIAGLTVSVAEWVEQGRIHELHGVGRGIGRVIEDLVRTGSSPLAADLRDRVPRELTALMRIAGLGKQKLRRLYRELGIQTVEDLENACRKHQVQSLAGFGSKTETQILDAIQAINKLPDAVPLAIALAAAESLREHLASWDSVQDVAIVGSVRRMRETVRNVNLLVASDFPNQVIDLFSLLPPAVEVRKKENRYCQIGMQIGRYLLPVDLRVVSPSQYGIGMVQFTGSREHLAGLQKRIEQVKLAQFELAREEGVYEGLGMPWIPPELREGRGEVEAALKNRLPRLIEPHDIRGDLHIHTTWSDGSRSIREMAEHARNMGYEYMAVTDHSKSLAIARGLSVDQLRRQQAEIQQLNGLWNDFFVFSGAEIDILPDGSLDYPDDVLAELDFVIGSVHSSFRQSVDAMTARIMAAMRNPYVHMIAHPTGRLLARRPGYALDFPQIMKTAAETGTAIEINCTPNRLDLNDVAAKMAKEHGVKLVINTDSHSLDELSFMRLGVATARRAWLTPGDVLNTWDRTRLQAFFQKKSRKPLYP
jgi:DNA polymerase (family 10)